MKLQTQATDNQILTGSQDIHVSAQKGSNMLQVLEHVNSVITVEETTNGYQNQNSGTEDWVWILRKELAKGRDMMAILETNNSDEKDLTVYREYDHWSESKPIGST